jgi:cytochrome c553
MNKGILCILVLILCSNALAHSGGTNGSGCHTDHNKKDYHCHNERTDESVNNQKEGYRESNRHNYGLLLLFGVFLFFVISNSRKSSYLSYNNLNEEHQNDNLDAFSVDLAVESVVPKQESKRPKNVPEQVLKTCRTCHGQGITPRNKQRCPVCAGKGVLLQPSALLKHSEPMPKDRFAPMPDQEIEEFGAHDLDDEYDINKMYDEGDGDGRPV